ncbi:ZIP family metal transporter [Candidatus Micrarchaeota archaeon]|nr:ZIP family metal transporter [Candidatus Micrarchaeota archaeon]
MDDILLYSVIATFIVSLISFIGVFTLGLKEKHLKKILILLVAFSAGALMGGAFLHLLPEALESSSSCDPFICVLFGFSIFFLLEKFLFWHHCHEHQKCEIHSFTYMNLIGDGVHNFIDGLIIVTGFIVSIPFGITTTIAIIAHEIPQEIGDFAVLLYGGWKKKKALLFNFASGLTAVLGTVIGALAYSSVPQFTSFLLPFAAGGFIYIASSDLIPELHKQKDVKRSVLAFIMFVIGIGFMYAVKLYFGG